MRFPFRWKSLDDPAGREDTIHFLSTQFPRALRPQFESSRKVGPVQASIILHIDKRNR
jgi:hypothetical protein